MSKELTDAKRKAIKKFDATHTKQYHLKLNVNTDADLIECLEQQKNVQGFLKQLIREHLNLD